MRRHRFVEIHGDGAKVAQGMIIAKFGSDVIIHGTVNGGRFAGDNKADHHRTRNITRIAAINELHDAFTNVAASQGRPIQSLALNAEIEQEPAYDQVDSRSMAYTNSTDEVITGQFGLLHTYANAP